MAGRHQVPRHPDDYRGFPDGHWPIMDRAPAPLRLCPSALEEELDMQHRQVQRIVADNRVIIDDNTLLQRELTAARDEVRRLGQIMHQNRADKEVRVRELIGKGLKLEAELHAFEPLKAEVQHLRAEVQNLNALRHDLSSQVQVLKRDVIRLQSENQLLTSMRADIDVMQRELAEARRAYEYEKKVNEEKIAAKQTMERNLSSVGLEIERLRLEQLERRSRGLGGGGYEMVSGIPDMSYPAGAYGDGYAGGRVPHDNRGLPRR